MMHRGRPIFRLVDDVTAPTLGGDRGITSTLQQRHPGSIDFTPLHPTLIRDEDRRNTPPKLRAPSRSFSSMANWYRASLFLFFSRSLSFSVHLFPSFLDQANLRDTLSAYMYMSYQPRMTTWAKRRRTYEDGTQKFVDQSREVLQSDVTRIAYRVIADR